MIYALVRNAKPQHVVEIGTYHGGTSEVICQALHENGSGMLHTVGPFDAERVVPIFEFLAAETAQAPGILSDDLHGFLLRMYSRNFRPEIAFIDGDHSYQAALFDIQSLARSLARRGFC